MRGKQAADSTYGYLATPQLAGGFWEHFDWQKALASGARASGLEYSGNFEFVDND
ncbi:MAG: hypothetical protein D9V47_08860 [Clostridia bacterium]|nr:MAG: hypothetical protein D9V47_08860 [Clostridia bacterium]